MSSLWRRIEILILRLPFHRNWQTSFDSVCVDRGILFRRNWLVSGFRRASTVSFFRPRQVPAETLQCIWQPLPLVALSFAIVPKYWRPSADTCREAWSVAIRFRLAAVGVKLFGRGAPD